MLNNKLILNEVINQDPTTSIIVCKKKNGYLFKYVTNKKIYEREYEKQREILAFLLYLIIRQNFLNFFRIS